MFVPGICGVFDLWVVSIEPLADYDLVEFCFLQPQEFLVFTYCHQGIEITIIFIRKFDILIVLTLAFTKFLRMKSKTAPSNEWKPKKFENFQTARHDSWLVRSFQGIIKSKIYGKLELIFHINLKMFFIPCLHELSAFFDDFKKAVEVGSYLFLNN